MVDFRYENCNTCWTCSKAELIGSELECNYKKRIIRTVDVVFSNECIERNKISLEAYKERMKR